jgi:hypothetical protein
MQGSMRTARMAFLAAASLGAVLTANAFAGVVTPGSCPSGPLPAATLLVPYFEVDLSSPDNQTTLVAVTNAGTQPTLAHVVVWTDWGVPSLTFDLYLGANDVQSLNLRDLFNGSLPQTGGPSFPGCTNPLTLPTLDPIALTALRKQHTGQADGEGHCSSSGRMGATVATGYLTIDAAQSCSSTITYPGHAGYFAPGGTGIASNSNTLVGDFFLVDTAENYAQGNEAISIVADAARFEGYGSTFYGAWVAHEGSDARAPLGTRYRSRYLNGGAFSGGTDLLVWTEPYLATPQPINCGERPNFVEQCQYVKTTAYDEAASGQAANFDFVVTEVAARYSVGSDDVPVGAPFGFVDFENRIQIGCVLEPIEDLPLQLIVMPVSSALGRFSVGFNAHRVGDELCPTPTL